MLETLDAKRSKGKARGFILEGHTWLVQHPGLFQSRVFINDMRYVQCSHVPPVDAFVRKMQNSDSFGPGFGNPGQERIDFGTFQSPGIPSERSGTAMLLANQGAEFGGGHSVFGLQGCTRENCRVYLISHTSRRLFLE